jgi:hypothetical protein
MMRAGKDYIAKGTAPDDEPEGARSKYLLELIRIMTPPAAPAELEEDQPAKAVNQDKPTLKLKR